MHHSNYYRAEIQGLRALAVMLVVVYHSGMGLVPGGYIGVDVFFVISGYLVAGPVLLSLNEHNKFDLVGFYARRILRLLPAAVLVLLATIAVFREIYSPLELKIFSSSAAATGAYLSNFWFAHLAMDYLANDANPNPLLHTWSLSVEEQFYIIWPLLFIAVHKILGRYRSLNALIWITGFLSLLSFCACVFLSARAQPWAFFLCFTRLWEFGLGAIAAVIITKNYTVARQLSNAGAVIGSLLIIGPAFLFSSSTPFPGYLVALPAIGTALILLCVDEMTPYVAYGALSNPVSQSLGNVSYSLYLWHWPVFVFVQEKGWSNDIRFQALGIVASVVLASLTYALIENPVRFSPLIKGRRARTFALAIILTVTALTGALAIRGEAKAGLNSPIQRALLAIKETRPIVYTDECHNQFLDVEINRCTYGNPQSKVTIALFGDSHAAHWFPALEVVAANNDARLVSYTKSSCPSVMFEPYDFNYKRLYTECTAWRLRVISALKNLKPDYLILSNSSEYQKTQPLSGDAWARGLNDLLLKLGLDQTTIIIMHDIPQLTFDGPVCLARADWQKKDPAALCGFERNSLINKTVVDAEKTVANEWKNVSAFDAASLICQQESCRLRREGVVKYFDSNHLSVAFSKQLGNELDRRLFR